MRKVTSFVNLFAIGVLSLLLLFSCSMPQQNIEEEKKEENLIINNVFDKDLSSLSKGDFFELSGFDDNTVFKLKNLKTICTFFPENAYLRSILICNQNVNIL